MRLRPLPAASAAAEVPLRGPWRLPRHRPPGLQWFQNPLDSRSEGRGWSSASSSTAASCTFEVQQAELEMSADAAGRASEVSAS